MWCWLKTVRIGLLLALSAAATAAEPVPAHAHGIHGMLLFGEPGRIFASHLPLYRHPHDWQVVLELAPGTETARVLAGELLTDGNLLTLEPEHFDLLRLRPDARAPLRQFRAGLYLGHFERGGSKLDSFDWRVKRIWWFEPVNASATASGQRYLVIGDGPGKQWLLHRVERRPDVDQILQIETTTALSGLLNTPALLGNDSRESRFRVTATVWQDHDDLQ